MNSRVPYAIEVLEKRCSDLQATISSFEGSYAKYPNQRLKYDIDRMKGLQEQLLLAMHCLAMYVLEL